MTTMATTLFCSVRLSPPSSSPLVHRRTSSCPLRAAMSMKSKLSSSTSISVLPSALPRIRSPTRPSLSPPNQPIPTVVAAKGYKMKTHKASAKRFRVTGSGKILRRKSGKQHLLAKKNTKRKLRLSKTVIVNRSDYDNVIGALPYLKVNRQNT